MKGKKSGLNPKPAVQYPGHGNGPAEGRQGRHHGQTWSVGQSIPQGKKGGKK